MRVDEIAARSSPFRRQIPAQVIGFRPKAYGQVVPAEVAVLVGSDRSLAYLTLDDRAQIGLGQPSTRDLRGAHTACRPCDATAPAGFGDLMIGDR